MIYYTSIRLIDGKPRKVIVDEIGNIVNRNPSKGELEELSKEPYHVHISTKVYTTEELLEYVRQFHKKYNKVPVQLDFSSNANYPSFGIYKKHFGSWNNAIKLAGFNNQFEYTREELLGYLTQFYKENGRPPSARDFDYNPTYPTARTYQSRFGSWSNALKLVGLDLDTMVSNGILQNCDQKARFTELIVIKYFQGESTDISGDNKNSCIDGKCPKGYIYDVKSSKLYYKTYYQFHLHNKEKGLIQYYFLLGFNKNRTKLDRIWLIPSEFTDRNHLNIYVNKNIYSSYSIYNMVEYEITHKFNLDSIVDSLTTMNIE